jgi:hypothetical protein
MSGWFERQLQKLKAKEQEYRAWLRDNLEEDASGSADSGQAEMDALLNELASNLGDDERTGESVSETASDGQDRQGGSSPSPRASHRRVLIQRAEKLLRRLATLDEAPAQEQCRRAERLADRLETYLQDTSEPDLDEQSDEEGSMDKQVQDPAGSEEKDQTSVPDQEEEAKEAAGPEGSDSGAATDPGVKQALCEVFIEWCHEGGAMMDRYYMFERRVRDEHGDAEVTPIYQDTRASGVELTYDAEDISDEFWLVEVGTRHLVFPQPRDATHFRTLDPLFDSVGDASPETLSDIRPAVVRLDGDSYLLESSGLVG